MIFNENTWILQNCNENNETNLLNMAMGITTKLSTADSCSKIGTSDEHSVSDLGNKIDGPKQPILESFEHSKISLSVSVIAEFEFVSSGNCLLFSLIFPDEF